MLYIPQARRPLVYSKKPPEGGLVLVEPFALETYYGMQVSI